VEAPAQEPAGQDESVYRLIYRSRSRLPAETRREDLGELFSQARSNNKRSGLTGALLLTDQCFVQALEGDEATVQRLFRRIAADDRHEAVSVIESGDVPRRVFSRWSMARVSADGDPDIPLLASDRHGVAAAASRPTTPEQDQLLDRMREAARALAVAG
jgi:hypothetical protein